MPMPDSDINIVIARLGSIHEDVGELKSTVRDLAQAVSRLALIEERQSVANEAVGRAFRKIEVHEQRIIALERAQPMHDQTTGWVKSAVWGAAMAACLIVARQAGVL